MSPIGNYQRRPARPLNGPCSVIVRAIKWVPVLFIFGVVCWSYYAYVIQLCFFAIDSIVERLFCLVLYHVVIVLFLWSYYQTVFTSVLQVPKKFYLPQGEWEKLQRADSQDQQKRVLDVFAKDLPITNRTVSGSIRYCDKCRMVKPDRTHHCSVCTMCVPKMDHHCPWVNNCVSYTNYKFFILFLGYALLYCVYVALTTLRFFILFWEGNLPGGMGRFHILFLFFVSVMFAISLVSLFGYHIYLVSLNRTTLESFRAPIFRSGGIDKNGYNLGRYNNFEEVFGERRLLWFFPIFTSLGDGIEYPVQTQHQPTMYESMSTTPPPNVHRIEDDDLTEVVANRNVGEVATNKPSFNLTQADVQNGSNKLHSVNQ